MQQSSVHILVTRPVEGSLIEQAGEAGLTIEVIPFIETELIQTVELQQEIEQTLLQTTSVVFTSPRAVEAVAAQLDEQEPEWAIYCIGNRTKELVDQYFGAAHIAGYASNATDLAQEIVESIEKDEIIFFCGDQRRQELPMILEQKQIHVEEIVVYQTIQVPRKLKKEYQGILFFSPSAVESFFRMNTIPAKTILFAIGSTTADAIKKYSNNKILIGDQPGKSTLLEMAIEYFT
jgi:uroporphyrinogen-III synthase